jgi:hypothetical protein
MPDKIASYGRGGKRGEYQGPIRRPTHFATNVERQTLRQKSENSIGD